ncbi:MAG: NfeD family protein, partial [Phycisphaeraceae bacterium]|nr:NfeD family protein [Phycisphaeraceae bacterium]
QADYQWMVHGQDPAPVTGGFLQQLTGQASLPSNVDPEDVGAVTRQVSTAVDQGRWRPVSQLPGGRPLPRGMVHDGKTLLTIGPTTAEGINLSEATLANDGEVAQWLTASKLYRVPETWSEGLAAWLTSPMVRGLLVLALLVGAYTEFQAPGLGLPGAVAAAALALLVVGPMLAGLADAIHLVMILFGLLLIAADLFFVMGFGVLALPGLLLMVTGLVLSAVPSQGGALPLPPPEAWGLVQRSVLWMLFGVLGGAAGIIMITYYFDQIPGMDRLVLAGASPRADLRPSAEGPAETGMGIQPGDTGRATTDLRPGGSARIGQQTVDVVSRGTWIERGDEIEVIEIHGNRVVVDKPTA